MSDEYSYDWDEEEDLIDDYDEDFEDYEDDLEDDEGMLW